MLRKYGVGGGKLHRFEVCAAEISEKRVLLDDGPEQFTGTGFLLAQENRGLDAYRDYLRLRMRRGNCEIINGVGFGYFRDGRQIGEEQFVDATGALALIRRERENVVVPELNSEGIPPVIFEAIVPPWLIEERNFADRARWGKSP